MKPMPMFRGEDPEAKRQGKKRRPLQDGPWALFGDAQPVWVGAGNGV